MRTRNRIDVPGAPAGDARPGRGPFRLLRSRAAARRRVIGSIVTLAACAAGLAGVQTSSAAALYDPATDPYSMAAVTHTWSGSSWSGSTWSGSSWSGGTWS